MSVGAEKALLNSFPAMVPYMAPIENLYFVGEKYCVLTFGQYLVKRKINDYLY